jgi:hypothetical protein
MQAIRFSDGTVRDTKLFAGYIFEEMEGKTIAITSFPYPPNHPFFELAN